MVFTPCSKLSEAIPSDNDEGMENQKKIKNSQLILDDKNVSFTPLVFTTNGGTSIERKQLYRQLSQLLCEKSDISDIYCVN